MKYAITRSGQYMREKTGHNCFTDDRCQAILFDTREEAEAELIGGEEIIEVDDDRGISLK